MKLHTPKELALTLAQRIKDARKAKHYSQKAISERAGVSYGSYRRFESTGEISLVSLLKVAQVLNLDDQLETLFVRKHFQSLDEVERSTTPTGRRKAGSR